MEKGKSKYFPTMQIDNLFASNRGKRIYWLEMSNETANKQILECRRQHTGVYPECRMQHTGMYPERKQFPSQKATFFYLYIIEQNFQRKSKALASKYT